MNFNLFVFLQKCFRIFHDLMTKKVDFCDKNGPASDIKKIKSRLIENKNGKINLSIKIAICLHHQSEIKCQSKWYS
jgi:hypothetical protein